MKVLGITIYTEGMDAAVVEFLALAQIPATSNLLVSPSDANVLVHARRNKNFKAILTSYFWNLPDGMPSVWVLKLKGSKHVNRISGPDFFEKIMKQSADTNITHYFCGGAKGVAEDLLLKCRHWGNANVLGAISPEFQEFTNEDYKKLAQKIALTSPDVLWIGLGAPKQIIFANEISKFLNVKFIVTIGAAFDFHTGRIKKAPKWMQNCGLEWLFRIWQEPRRLGRRYVKVVPLFLWYNFIDLFKR